MLSSRDATVLEMPTILDAENKDPTCCSWTMQGPCAAANHKDQRTRLIPSILPLNLVRCLVGGLNHPGPGAKLKELDPPKGLGEQIRKLILGVDVARLDASFLQAASDEVIPHPDVLAPFVKNGVLRQGQSGQIGRAHV